MQMEMFETTGSLEDRLYALDTNERENFDLYSVAVPTYRVPLSEFAPLVSWLGDFDEPPADWNMQDKLDDCSAEFIESVKAIGIQAPITIEAYLNEGFAIYEGHHRFALAVALGLEDIPVSFDYPGLDPLPRSNQRESRQRECLFRHKLNYDQDKQEYFTSFTYYFE